ncbi:MAG: enoyl-CoA hydratase [Qipengyuania sp.]|nr:enoyl-CoA hydratase [Qipengyuania sp.]
MTQGNQTMPSTSTTKLFAAAFSLIVSALFFATAILPASPNGLIA